MASLKATCLVLLSLSAAARAQDIVESDFDDGGVAQWSFAGGAQPGSSMQVTASAAHRGAYGLRFVDGTATGASTNAHLWQNFLLDGGVFDVNIRTWVRFVAADAGPDQPQVVKLTGAIAPYTTLATTYVKPGFLQSLAYDRNGVLLGGPLDPGPDAGHWFLLEQLAQGLGSVDGGAYSYIDGQPTGGITNIDWAGVVVAAVNIGEQYGLPSWLGTMDFDDVRASRFPMASTLRVSAPASADAGECIQAAVSLWSTDLRAAGAPYDLDVALEPDGGSIQVFESDCATPATGAHFTIGQTAGVAWVRPGTTGTLTLTARHTDFLSGSTSLSVVGGGSPLALNVGCDCASAGSGVALALVAVVAAAHRRRRRLASLKATCLVLLSLSATAARAQDIVESDFDDGGVAQWDLVGPPQPGSSMQVTALAAHRGAYGVRIVDGTATGANTNAYLWKSFLLDGGVFDVNIRTWIRFVAADAGPDTPEVLKFGGTVPGGTMASMHVSLGYLILQTNDRNGVLLWAPADTTPDAGRWFLLEQLAWGVGSGDGGASSYIDGQPTGAITNVDWAGMAVDSMCFGEQFGRPSWVGTMDFDDVRVSRFPMASTLHVSAPASADAGECIQATVSFWSTDLRAAGAPYDLNVALQADGGSIQVLEADCATPSAGAHFTVGQTAGTAWVRPGTLGTLTLTARHTDFLSGSTSLSVGGAGPLALNVGCDCASAGPGFGFAVGLLLVAAASARRRGKACPR